MTDKQVRDAILSGEVVCLRAARIGDTTRPAGVIEGQHGRDGSGRMQYEVRITSPGWHLEVGWLVACRADEMFISKEYLVCQAVS